MRVVLDTNVLVSGLLVPDGIPGKIVQAWRSASFTLVVSEPMLAEVGRVLLYPKIRKRLGWGAGTVRRFVALVRFMADVAAAPDPRARVPRDPRDWLVLGTFLSGHADFLVSGDGDLLALRNRYPVLSPTEFWRRVGW